MSEMLLDRAGRRRSPATMPGFHAGRAPRNKGLRYPADPPKVEEIVAVMRKAGDDAHGQRLHGLIVVLWRAGLRIQEALALAEANLDYSRGALLVRRGKDGRRRKVGMDTWGWDELQPWLERRVGLPVGPLFCVLNGRTRGRQWSTAAARAELRRTAVTAGSADDSPRISCATPMPSRWLAKACRSSSSSANSAIATSASPRSTSKASTTPRSSTPSTPAARQ
jgi:site-specific recombinase XerC